MAKKKVEEKEPVYYKVYSDEELSQFNSYLEKYRVTKTLSTGDEVSYIKWEKWLVDEGAYCMGQGGYSHQFYIENVHLYRELRDKLDQWSRWSFRKDFGRKMADRQLDVEAEKVAESMVVDGVDN